MTHRELVGKALSGYTWEGTPIESCTFLELVEARRMIERGLCWMSGDPTKPSPYAVVTELLWEEVMGSKA